MTVEIPCQTLRNARIMAFVNKYPEIRHPNMASLEITVFQTVLSVLPFFCTLMAFLSRSDLWSCKKPVFLNFAKQPKDPWERSGLARNARNTGNSGFRVPSDT